MYKNIRNLLEELKNNELIAIIDEGRSRKSKKKCLGFVGVRAKGRSTKERIRKDVRYQE